MSADVLHEPSAWLRAAIANAIPQGFTPPPHLRAAVVVPLGRTHGRWDRTCDRCQTYVPPGPPFYVDLVNARPGLHVIVGLCQTCRHLERGGQP